MKQTMKSCGSMGAVGVRAGGGPIAFYSETAMLQWLLANNISVYDLSLLTGATHYLYKGAVMRRATSAHGCTLG